ncbi:MAG: ABC transporter permease [Alphaproteobacteria bacterium]
MNVRGTYTLCRRETLRFRSVWLQTILGPVISVLLFVVVFTAALGRSDIVISGTSYVAFIVPGLVLMAMLQNAFANTSSSLLIAKVSGTIVDVLMAPLAPFELVIGYATAAVFRALIIAALLVSVVAPFVDIAVNSWPLLIAVGLLASMAFAVLGIITGILATRMEHVAGMSMIIIAPLTMLAGTFYSVSTLTEPFQALSYLNPVFYAVDAFRDAFTGVSEGAPVASLIGLIVANFMLFGTAVLMFRNGYRLKG